MLPGDDRPGREQRGRALDAMLAADKAVSHGRVVSIIDLLRREGVVRFAISVLKKEG